MEVNMWGPQVVPLALLLMCYDTQAKSLRRTVWFLVHVVDMGYF